MAITPRKLVHWDIDGASISGLGSPFFNGSTDSVVSTSSLEYINPQLVAHGFCTSPGLILDGISGPDLERVVKCLLGMLSQRMEDMSRTEELTTKLRTLTYDHDRLMSMHRTETERADNAEREMNVHKSRLTSATRTLQSTEVAHKHTTTELQRTRNALQALRVMHQTELKKKEKDIERMTEKWSKLADAQVKLTGVPSGMRCANICTVEGSEVFGRGQGYLEIALEQAESAGSKLRDENVNLKRLILSAVNEVQSSLHQARHLGSQNDDEPVPFTLATLFPLYPIGNAGDKLNCMLAGLRDLVALSSPDNVTPFGPKDTLATSGRELKRLQGIITTLEEEIERSRKQSLTQATETQAIFDQFVQDHRLTNGDVGEMSIELMTAPLRDEEKERLDNIRMDLDLERTKFTEAAIKLGKEKAALEAERIKLLDEKRSWQVAMMLAELPPTPQPASPVRMASPKKSPRKSPAKVYVGKAGTNPGRKVTRVSRRSLASPHKIIPSYETEVLPPIPPPAFTIKPLSLASSLLSTSFVLPPPSPHASLPTQPALLSPVPPTVIHQPQHPTSATVSLSPPPAPAVPSTPVVRPFPMAKPFAQRMIHAYSPVKPSPLSRILMLGNSPNSPNGVNGDDSDTSGMLKAVIEEDEDVLGFEEMPKLPEESSHEPQQMSLAAELGVKSPPENSSREKKPEINAVIRSLGTGASVTTTKGRVFHPDPKRFTTKEKGKGRAEAMVVSTSARARISDGVEKENGSTKPGVRVFSAPEVLPNPSKKTPPGIGVSGMKKPVKPATKSTTIMSKSRPKILAKIPAPPNKGGPRRVLVDSAEAPAINKGWKG